ncbi:MAG: hypothetical protein KAS93_07810 [Gammaproteobacteria bacterium]|nr:hypothetical protein [Gammaproteobacteria bacterium]
MPSRTIENPLADLGPVFKDVLENNAAGKQAIERTYVNIKPILGPDIKGTDDLLKNAMMAGLAVVVAARRTVLQRCFDVMQKQLLRVRRFELDGGVASFSRFVERDDAVRPVPELRLLPTDLLDDAESEEEAAFSELLAEYNNIVQATAKLERDIEDNHQKIVEHVDSCVDGFKGEKTQVKDKLHEVIQPYVHGMAPQPEPAANKKVRPEVHWAAKPLPDEAERFVDDLHGSMRRAGFVPYPSHRQSALDLHTDIVRNNALFERYVSGILRVEKLLERLEKMSFPAEQDSAVNAMPASIACR